MENIIIERLGQLEKEKNIKILYACESGSRAWGFPSLDSDYDVRFLYVHPLDYYLSIHIDKKREVIELPFKDNLDIAGWDLKKTLDLFFRSNAAVMEWIHSPKRYIDKSSVIEELRDLAHDYYNLKTLRYHYLNMAKNAYQRFQLSLTPNLKQFFYVLRAIFSVKWIDSNNLDILPCNFVKLMEAVIDDEVLKNEIKNLIDIKKQKNEKDEATEVNHLTEYINDTMNQLNDDNEELVRIKPEIETLDQLFRSTLKTIGEF